MKMIKVNYQGKSYEIEQCQTTLDFIEQHQIDVIRPMAVVINGHFTRLNRKMRVDSSIEIISYGSPQGRRIYEASTLFVFMTVFQKTHPDLRLFIQHSIHKGVYAEIQGRELNQGEIKELENKMKQLVEEDAPIIRIDEDWDTALEQMKERDRKDMINLYRYYLPTLFKMYELDGIRESLYMPLVPSCGVLQNFELVKYEAGVVVMLPNKEMTVPKFVERPKLFSTYKEYHEWSRIMKVRTVGQLNKYIMNDEIGELVKVAEAFHEKRIAAIADEITHKRKNIPRLVLIAGPSSSGKTTFSKRLGIQLRVNGFRPVTISMDNYFVDREMTPKDEEGNYDFEALEAIDVALFTEQISKLLAGESVELPKFDFHTGCKKGSGKIMKLNDDQIIVIEGIHGLNPKLTNSIPEKDKFKIYISALTQLNLHRHDRIATSDTRLLRRMVRDSYFRGYSASDTLNRWESVRNGEKKNIFPLQEEADTIFNSALFYEICVLKTHAERELLRVDKNDPMYSEARRLLKFLSYFRPLDPEETPSTSILKEFIGGSTFRY